MRLGQKLGLGALALVAGSMAYSVIRTEPTAIEYVTADSNQPALEERLDPASLDSSLRREVIEPTVPKDIEPIVPQVLSDEDYVSNLFSRQDSLFALIGEEMYAEEYGLLPTKEAYSGFYSELCRILSESTLEEIANTIPRSDVVWTDLPELYNMVYHSSYGEETKLKDVYADKIPTKEEIASDWNPQVREKFTKIAELSALDHRIDGFYGREKLRTESLRGEALENIETDMQEYMPFLRESLSFAMDVAEAERLISKYGEFCILEASGQVEVDASNWFADQVYGLLEGQRALLEAEYGNQELVNMLKLKRAFNTHSVETE